MMGSFLITLAAFDIGSGAIRMQVADVDQQAGKIKKVHFAGHSQIDFARDLKMGQKDHFSQEIMDEAVALILELKSEAQAFKPAAYRGIATEAFRMSKNGDELIRRLFNDAGVSIKIASHEEEAVVGFYNAMSYSGLSSHELISWDSGAGSLQVTSHDGKSHAMFLARLGRVPVQHYIVETLQNRDFSRHHSPNPIEEQHAHQAIDYIKSQLTNIPEPLLKKLENPDIRVLAIGAHSKLIPVNEEYSLEDIETLLFTHLNKSDHELAIEDAQYAISDLILEYSVMSSLGIKKAYRLSTKSAGNTSGLLIDHAFWR